jgi:hypothetical protein
MSDLEKRIEGIERRLEAMERLFRAATGHDPNLEDHSAAVYKLVAETPGMSQAGVCRAARERYTNLGRLRVIEVLRLGAGRRWRVEGGQYNSLLYFPSSHAREIHAADEDARHDSEVKVIEDDTQNNSESETDSECKAKRYQ